MRIGELARASGLSVPTLRFYEREGLLPPPARSEGNYRHYSPAQVERALFIRRCRALGLSLDELRALLAARDEQACEAVNSLIDRHLAHVQARRRELEALEAELQALRARCQGQGEACGILERLATAPLGPERPAEVHGRHERD